MKKKTGAREPENKKANSSILNQKSADGEETESNTSSQLALLMQTGLRCFTNKPGEFVYAKPGHILLIEADDYQVKMKIRAGDEVVDVSKHCTLCKILKLLPEVEFFRINRYYAVNLFHLTGANMKKNTLQFDFSAYIKLDYWLPASFFSLIGR